MSAENAPMWFDEQGSLHGNRGPMVASLLTLLSEQLHALTAQIETCRKTDQGKYELTDSAAVAADTLETTLGARQRNIVVAVRLLMLHGVRQPTAAEMAVLERVGKEPPMVLYHREFLAVVHALEQLDRCGIWEEMRSGLVPAERVAQVRSIAKVLEFHRPSWERREAKRAAIFRDRMSEKNLRRESGARQGSSPVTPAPETPMTKPNKSKSSRARAMQAGLEDPRGARQAERHEPADQTPVASRQEVAPRRRRPRGAAQPGWIYLNDATERYQVPRTTLQDFTAELPGTERVKDEDSGQTRVLESKLREILKKRGRLKS